MRGVEENRDCIRFGSGSDQLVIAIGPRFDM
jgi:hypothetical protein